MSNSLASYKQAAALAAVELIEDGMLLGLGHGSTVQFALEAIADRVKAGQLGAIMAIPCSRATQREAEKLGIPLTHFDFKRTIAFTIDGADQIDPSFNLIKGGGAALLREKLVAQESQREVIIADHSKLTQQLGKNFRLPIEVSPFGWQRQIVFVDSLGARALPRKYDNDEMVLTDQGNYLLDCEFGPIKDPANLAAKLEQRAGILEHGLFLNLATDVIVAGPNGLQHHSNLRH